MANTFFKAPRWGGYRQGLLYLAFLGLILIQVIWFFPSLSRVKENIALLQLEIADRAQSEILLFFEQHTGELKRMAGIIAFSENKDSLLSGLLKDSDIQQVVLLNKTGVEVSNFHRYKLISSSELKDRSGESWAPSVLLSGENYLGPVYSENLEPLVNLFVPLKTSETEISGAIEITLNLKRLWTTIGGLTVGGDGSVYVIDTGGLIIAHKDPNVVLAGTSVLDRPIAKKLIIDKAEVAGFGAESRYLDINDKEVFGVGIPIKTLGWGVIVEQPWSEAFAAQTQIIWLAIVAVGLNLALLILLQIMLGRLVKAAALLSTEKQKAEDLSQNLEIKVREKTKELAQEKTGLEVKVKERTQELSEKIIELERFQKFAVGREVKMVQLKEEIGKLKEELEKLKANK